ncbi:hypothetical protein ACL6C3_03560 [Capilliphycus salinus ALCB114379]
MANSKLGKLAVSSNPSQLNQHLKLKFDVNFIQKLWLLLNYFVLPD